MSWDMPAAWQIFTSHGPQPILPYFCRMIPFAKLGFREIGAEKPSMEDMLQA